jgi:hypothetical protein
MDVLRLASSSSDAVLELSEVDGDDFRATVRAHDRFATLRVCAYTDPRGIVRLFAEAARDWRGWTGAKAWESLEGELGLQLTTDRLGHVTLAVRLRADLGGPDPWQLQAELGLDAGRLGEIARDAERLWRGEA